MLGANQYGKAETHLVRVVRDGDVHELRDLLVSVALSGALDAVHLRGDNAAVLATDTQKNTVYAFAKERGVGTPEQFAALLARHFVGGAITRARVQVVEAGWARLGDHAFVQSAREQRVATVICSPDAEWYGSGLTDLVVLKTTDSEFHGFPRDRYTTLAETTDRILATAVTARWRYTRTDLDFDGTYATVRTALLETFAATHSFALQQSLFAMGEAVLERCADVAEIRMSMPNKHHFLQDLSAFGLDDSLDGDGAVVYHADDRPYGLIEGSVQRDDTVPADVAWEGTPGFC